MAIKAGIRELGAFIREYFGLAEALTVEKRQPTEAGEGGGDGCRALSAPRAWNRDGRALRNPH